jgi:Icc protein
VLSGHKHRHWIWNLDGTYFITCGTSASRRLKGRGYPSLMIYNIDEGRLRAEELNVRDNILAEKLSVSFRL